MKNCKSEASLFNLISGLLQARPDYAKLLGSMEPDLIVGKTVNRKSLSRKLDSLEANFAKVRKMTHTKTIPDDWRVILKEKL